jgi:uncharacterized protein DUF998
MSAVIADARHLTRRLLACGTVAGPLFFGVAITQALVRPGYNIRKNAISQLSLGDLGWIQITGFLLTGPLAVACAIGMRRALRGQRGGTWGAFLVGMFGLGLVVAGIFPPDPAFGFPPGAPAGQVMPMSGHADLHALGFFISMISAIIATFVFARRFRFLGNWAWVTYCAVSGVAAPIIIALSIAIMSWAGVIVALAGAVVFGWVAATAARLRYEVSII